MRKGEVPWKSDILVFLVFACVSYIVLGANMFSGEIVAPMDLLLNYPGWRNVGIKLILFNPERSDILDYYIPHFEFMRSSILAGKFPLWNYYRNGGKPAFPWIMSSFLFYLIFGNGYGFTLGLIFKLTTAGFGTYKLLRRRLESLPALFGGFTYMLCGFNTSWLMWPHVEASMWIPWLLWAVESAISRKRPAYYMYITLFITLLVFSEFPFVAFGGLLLSFMYLLWDVFIFYSYISHKVSRRSNRR